MDIQCVSTPRARFAMTLGDIRKSGRSVASFIIDECRAVKEPINASEQRSWEKSIPALLNIVNMSEIPDSVMLVCEYEIAGGRCDWLLIGADNEYPVVILGENKQWTDWGVAVTDGMLNAVVSIGGKKEARQYPLVQIRNYKEQIEGIIKFLGYKLSDIKLFSVIYMHNAKSVDDIRERIEDYERVYAYSGNREDSIEFAKFLKSKLTQPDTSEFMSSFLSTNVTISPDSVTMIKDALSDENKFGITMDLPFINKYSLNEEEWVVLSQCKQCFLKSGENIFPNRFICAITGKPGTGKTYIATTLLDYFLQKNMKVVFCVKNRERRQQLKIACKEIVKTKYPSFNDDNARALYRQLASCIITPSVRLRDGLNYDVMIFDEAQTLSKYVSHVVVDENGYAILDEKGRQQYEVTEDDDSYVLNMTRHFSRVAYFFYDEDQKISTKDFLTTDILKEHAAKNNINFKHYELHEQTRFLGGSHYCDDIHDMIYSGYDGSFRVRTGGTMNIYITREYGDLTYAETERKKYEILDAQVADGRPYKEGFQIGALWSSDNPWRSNASEHSNGYDFENLFMYDEHGNKVSVFMNWNPGITKLGKEQSFMYLHGRNTYVAYTPNMLGNEVGCFYLLIPKCYKYDRGRKKIVVDTSMYGYEENKRHSNTPLETVMLNELYIMLSRMQDTLILSVEDDELRHALKYALNAITV